MKKLFYILPLFLLSLAFIACDDDNEEPKPPYNYNPLKGRWVNLDDALNKYSFTDKYRIYKGKYEGEEGKHNEETGWKYDIVADNYTVGYTTFTTYQIDSVNGTAVKTETGKYEYTRTEEGSGENVKYILSIRKAKSGNRWTNFVRVLD